MSDTPVDTHDPVSKYGPKAQPVIYGFIATAISTLLAKYGANFTPTQVYAFMIVMFAAVQTAIWRRVSPVHADATKVVTK